MLFAELILSIHMSFKVIRQEHKYLTEPFLYYMVGMVGFEPTRL